MDLPPRRADQTALQRRDRANRRRHSVRPTPRSSCSSRRSTAISRRTRPTSLPCCRASGPAAAGGSPSRLRSSIPATLGWSASRTLHNRPVSAMQLYSTLARDVVELPEAPGPIGMYVCGPTVYARAHIGNARPYVIAVWYKRWLRERGYDVTLVHNITDVNDKIYEAAPGRAPREPREATRWYVEDTGRFLLDEVDHWPKATETIDEIIAFIVELIERGLRLRGRGRRLLPRLSAGRSTAASPGRSRIRSRSRSRTRARKTRATSRSGRRTSRGRTPGGTRPGVAAVRAGTSSARRWRRSCSARSSRSTAAGSTSSSRITRTSSRSRGRSATSSRRSGCTTGCSASPARRCRSRSATSRRSRRCSTSGAARRCCCSS